MDSVGFVSSRVSDRKRDLIREQRKNILDKAERQSKKEAERREKEGSWMLPDVEENLFSSSSKSKKSKKEKKSKKKSKKSKKKRRRSSSSSNSDSDSEEEVKKSKKSKKKRKKRSSSSSSNSDSEDEWVEKKSSTASQQRDSWMQLGGDFSDFSRNSRDLKSHGKVDKKANEREAQDAERIKKLAQRELNPELRNQYIQQSSGSSMAIMKRAIERVEERAALEKKSVEEIAIERWGSIDKFNEMKDKVRKHSIKEQEIKEVSNREEEMKRVATKGGWKTQARKNEEKSSIMKSESLKQEPKEEEKVVKTEETNEGKLIDP